MHLFYALFGAQKTLQEEVQQVKYSVGVKWPPEEMPPQGLWLWHWFEVRSEVHVEAQKTLRVEVAPVKNLMWGLKGPPLLLLKAVRGRCTAL